MTLQDTAPSTVPARTLNTEVTSEAHISPWIDALIRCVLVLGHNVRKQLVKEVILLLDSKIDSLSSRHPHSSVLMQNL